jgi:hypothetical protein
MGVGALELQLFAAPCTIVYLGNSITAQKSSYRIPLHSFLVHHYKKIHKPVNAGLGGVGSLACAFLVDDLVLRHRPALCFIECSAADTGGATPLDAIGPAVEGIIRQLIAVGVQVVFLHLFRRNCMAVNKETILRIYESLADHYRIPSMNLDMIFSELIASGNFREEELFQDGIHTTIKGASMTGEIIGSLFTEMAKISADKNRPFPEPVFELPYQYTRVLPVSAEMCLQNGQLVKNRFRDLLEYTEINAEEEVSLLLEDHFMRAILIVADADSGVVVVEIKGIKQYIQTWDEWCFMPRIQAIILDKPVQPGTTLRISLSMNTRGTRGATGAPNTHDRLGKILKIIGFMTYSSVRLPKISLLGG